MAWLARKRMTLLGRTYLPGEVVPLGKFGPGISKKLIEQNRVVPRGDDEMPGSPEPEPVAAEPKTVEAPPKRARKAASKPRSKATGKD